MNSDLKSTLGIYVHIPYCLTKCPYCNFNSYAVSPDKAQPHKQVPLEEEPYVEALIAELDHYWLNYDLTEKVVRTVFFGGGTPSLFTAQSIERIIQAIGKTFRLNSAAEISLEANPGTLKERINSQKMRDLKLAGANRVSLGAQSFSERKLKYLGRVHGSADILRSVENIRAGGFDNFNLDLIFGLAGETEEEWDNDLATALAEDPSHISAYTLTIEPGTEFWVRTKKGALLVGDEERVAKLFKLTQSTFSQSGFKQYEISNYAKPGFECQHNLGYWSLSDYLGLGAGAHSFFNRLESRDTRDLSSTLTPSPFGQRWSNITSPQLYIERVLSQGSAVQHHDDITEVQAELEFFFLGLRTMAGFSLNQFGQRFKRTISDTQLNSLSRMASEGLVTIEDGWVRVSPRGSLFTDALLEELI